MSHLSRFAWVSALSLGAWTLSACGGAFGGGSEGTGGSAGGGGCVRDGKTYANGESIPAGDGCNTCSCQGGQLSCTLMMCVDSCSYNGATYQVGKSFPSTDGCNTCTCEQGGNVACTTLACVDQCTTLVSTYTSTLDPARACDPQQVNQCTQRVSGGLLCNCDTFVNPANAAAIATLQSTQQQYAKLACVSGVMCEPCVAPSSAHCSAAGKCVDDTGISCKVNGVVYPDGSNDIPDPVSCNTCSCVAGQLSCTKIACPKPCPTGTVYSTQCAQCGPTDNCLVVEYSCLPACTSTCASGSCIDGACKASVCG